MYLLALRYFLKCVAFLFISGANWLEPELRF